MQDGYLPFTDVDESFKELTGGELTKMIKSNEIESLKQEKEADYLYKICEIYYAKKLKSYVTVSKYSPEKDLIECKVDKDPQ